MARSRKKDIIVLPPPRADYGVVLLSHGSADPRSRLATDLLARRVGHRLNAAVALASLDHDRARLDGAVQQLASRGVNQVVVVPLLLNVAYHATSDVPEAATQIKFSHPDAKIRLARPLGADPALLKGLDAVIKTAGFRPNQRTGVVLASAGSNHESARARHTALALEWRSHGWGASAVAFVSGPGPRVADAVASLRDYELDRTLVVPFVIAPGVMSQRIGREAREAGAIAISTTLHSTDAAVDVVVSRIQSALEHEPLVSSRPI